MTTGKVGSEAPNSKPFQNAAALASRPSGLDRVLSGSSFWVALAVLQVLGIVTLLRPELVFPNRLEIRPVLLAGFGITTALALLGARFGRPLIFDLLIAIALFGTYLASPAPHGIGDTSWKALSTDETNRLWASSYLSHLLLRFLFDHSSELVLLAPICGLVAIFACLGAIRRLPGAHIPSSYLAGRLLLLGAGAHLLFFRGFVETTMPALPFLMGGIWLLLDYSTGSRRSIAPASAGLILACLFHGQNLVFLPVLPAAVILKYLRELLPIRLAKELGEIFLTLVVMLAIATFATIAFGYDPVRGDSSGGGDARILPPDLLSIRHLFEVAMIQTLAFVVTILLALFLIIGSTGRFPTQLRGELSLLALGSLAFVSFWGFDFGYPMDYDLMVGHTLAQLPLLAVVIGKAAQRLPKTVAGLLFPAIVFNLLNIGSLLGNG